jgi:hypothetical protein
MPASSLTGRHGFFTAGGICNRMKEILDKIKESLFTSETEAEPLSSIRIVKARKIILRYLQSAMESQKAIGIYSKVLGEGMFITGVESILSEGKEEIVTLKPYDMSGILLARNQISISEIKSVCPFDSFYLNPVIIA